MRKCVAAIAGGLFCAMVVVSALLFIAQKNDRLKTKKDMRQMEKNVCSVGGCMAEEKIASSSAYSFIVPFDKDLFFHAINLFPHQIKHTPAFKFKGAIVPHHDLASDLIAEALQKISFSSSPTRVVIIGPNHPDLGGYAALTGDIEWQHLGGKVQTDKEAVEKLVATTKVKKNNKLVAEEHSVFTLVPFVEYYFPQARVVPLILSSKLSIKKSEDLVKVLAPLIDDATLVIASVDFSHYLSTFQVTEKDRLTEKLIFAREYQKISLLNNDYLDSPPSVMTVLMLMDASGVSKTELLRHSHSGELLQRDFESSTSYFTFLFR